MMVLIGLFLVWLALALTLKTFEEIFTVSCLMGGLVLIGVAA